MSESRFATGFDAAVLLPDNSSGPQPLLRNPLDEVTGTLYLGDGLWLDSGFNTDVGRLLDRFNPNSNAFDGLFYSQAALGSSYAGLSSGGTYFGFGAELMKGLRLSIGQASSRPGYNRFLLNPFAIFDALSGREPYDYRATNSVVAGMSWDFARWGGVELTASSTNERGGALGLVNPLVGGARTNAVGVSAHVGFGGGWVTTASYSEGLTQLALRPGAKTADTTLRSEAYGVAVAKHGLFSKFDALGLAFARPALSFGTAFNNTTAAAAEKPSDLKFFGRDKVLSALTQETDIELGYKTEFFGNSVALQANASYQMNYGGMNGNNAVSLLSKAKIKF